VDRFNGSALGPNWRVYNDPDGSTPRTTQSVTVGGGSLNLIGHYQAPYGYVGGGVADVSNQTYGLWEIQFRADVGAGYEPVVLLWPEGTWPNDGEIDIAEVFPGTAHPASTNRLGDGQFLHMGANDSFLQDRLSGVDFSKWQTLALTWLPGKITWWLNGKPTWTVTAGEGGMDYIPDTPFHLALQMDENCNDRCAPNSATPSQVVMQVNWVKVYALPASAAG
jgi:Glycosyl hydrolases family 16